MKKQFYPLFLILFPFLFSTSEADAQTAKTLLWKISGNGLDAPSYLFGTMHVADKRAHKFKKSVLEAFEGVDAYAMELDPAAVNPMDLLEKMKLKEGKLQDLFTEEEWNRLDAHFESKFNTSISSFNDFTPFYVQTMMMQAQFGSSAGEAVDIYFYNQAKKMGKAVYGLETMDEQLSAITALPQEDQKQMLLDGLDEDFKSSSEKMLKTYKKGDLDKLLEMSEDESLGDEFENALIVGRNHTMAERIQPIIKKQSAFIGVGALHLPGEEGIIELLKKAGYQVEPIK